MQVVDVNGNMFGYDHLEIIGADGRPKTLDSGLTSVGLSMPSAFSVSNSPLTSNGTIGVTGAGTTSQYIDGTGSLRSFPSLTGYVPYTGATQDVDLGIYRISASAIVKAGGTSAQFLKADGSIDSNTYLTTSAAASTYVPLSRELTINGTTYDLSANRTWSVGTVTAVTATGPLSSSGGTTPNITISQASGTDNGYLSSTDWTTFNNKQPAGNYITALSGEATGSGPGTASVTLNNASVTAKVLTGVNVTGGSINASDSILTAFGKLQNQINGLIGSSIYQGTWNALTNNPALTSGVGTRGYYYIVNVAGSTNLDGITDWNVGDWAIFDGTAWQQVDNTDSVTSVNGQTGAVSLTSDNIPEGVTNLYFTNLRARQALSLTTSGSSGASTYSNTTGILNVPNYTLSGLGGVPTSRRLEINGVSYDLSADRSWSVGTVTAVTASAPLSSSGGTTPNITISQASGTDNGFLSSTDWTTFNNKQNAITLTTTGSSGAATLIGSTLNIPNYSSALSGYVPTSRQLTINGTSYDLSADRSWDVGTVTSIGVTAGPRIVSEDGPITSSGNITISHGIGQGLDVQGAQDLMNRSIEDGGSFEAFRCLATSLGELGDFETPLGTFNSIGTVVQNIMLDEFGHILGIGSKTLYTSDIIEDTNLYFTDARARAAISLTTTGTSGAATYNNSTGVLNIPQYQSVITNPVTGTGTANYVAKWSDTDTITNSVIYENGGNIGINNTSPTQKLDVNGTIQSSNGTINTFMAYGASTGLAGTLSNHDYLLLTNSGERMRITAAGNVGIGTTSPSQKFDVIGAGIFGTMTSSRSAYSNGLSLQNNTGEATSLFLWQSGVASAHIGSPANSTSLHIVNSYNTGLITDPNAIVLTNTGNVGIGTTSPSAKLTVLATSTGYSSDAQIKISDSSTSYYGGLSFDDAGSTRLSIRNSFDGVGSIIGFGFGSSSDKVQIIDGTGLIVNEGNVGIGTTSPARALTIVSNNPQIRISDSTAPTTNFWEFNSSFSLTNQDLFIGNQNGNLFRLNNIGALRLYAYGSGSFTGTRAYDLSVDSSGNIIEVPVGAGTITGSGTTNYLPKFTSSSAIGNSALQEVSGNLGLGVTPSAWNTVTAFQVGSTSLGGYSNTGYVNSNAFYQTGWKYVNSSFAARYEINASDAGIHAWFNAPSGTAGNAISFTQAMTLDASGNLLVGPTSAVLGTRIEIGAGKRLGFVADNATAYIFANGPLVTNVLTSDYISWSTNNAERMRITSAGNVGIGTTSPAAKLQINYTSGNAGLLVTGPIGDTWFPYTNGINYIRGELIVGDIGSTNVQLVTGGGNVSIGNIAVSALNERLNVTGNGITLEATDGGITTILGTFGSSNSIIGTYTNDNLEIRTNNTSRLFISNSGNVGIGTTSPTTPLEISHATGNALKIATNDSTTNNNAGVIIENVASSISTTRRSVFIMDPTSGTGTGGDYFYITSYGNGLTSLTNAKSDGILVFGTADTERMRITNAGRLGIGTTTPGYVLEVNGGSDTFVASFINSSASQSYIRVGDTSDANYSGLALYSDSGSGQIFKNGTGSNSWGGNASLNIYNSNGSIAFHPNNTANAMFIATNGNVGIGTTTPNNSAILDLTSRSKGFLPPRMTNTEMNAIASPAAGLVVYDTTNNKLTVYNGSTWAPLH